MLLVNNHRKDDDFMLVFKIKDIYKEYGKISLLDWFKKLIEQPSDKDSTLVFQNNLFCFKPTWQIELDYLDRLFRVSYLAQKYFAIWKYQIKGKHPKTGNEIDLLHEPFTGPCLSFLEYNTTFKFSVYDIHHIIEHALKTHDECIPCPCLPKNPYTNHVFTVLELKRMFNFLHKHRSKLSQLLLLFEATQFSIEEFTLQFKVILRKTACLSHIHSMNLYQKLDLILNFISTSNISKINLSLDEIIDFSSERCIKKYIGKYFDNSITIFRDYLYYFHFNSKKYQNMINNKEDVVLLDLKKCME